MADYQEYRRRILRKRWRRTFAAAGLLVLLILLSAVGLLKVSPRTLQTLRDNGTLAYTQICHKTYYKPGDVESIIRIVEERRKRAESMGRSI